MPLPPAAGSEVHAECLFTLPSLAYSLLPLPWAPYQTTALRHLTQEEGERAQAAAAELQASVEELQAREAASEGQLQQSLAAANEENRQLKDQLAVRMGWADGCAGVQTTEIDALPQYRLCSPLHAHQPGPPPAFSTYCRPPRSRPSHWASS